MQLQSLRRSQPQDGEQGLAAPAPDFPEIDLFADDADAFQNHAPPVQANKPPENALARSDLPPWMWMVLTVLTSVALTGATQFWATSRAAPPPIVLQAPPTAAPSATPPPTPTPAPIKVFVSGAVRQPDLYELPADARVADLLEVAGGMLPDADSILINQAEPLYDGAQVHVPLAGQVVTAEQPVAGVSGRNLLQAQVSSPGGSVGGKVNINTASIAELTTLPGIGESRANEIVAGRPYQSVDELDKVSGIGEKTMEKLRDLVTVE